MKTNLKKLVPYLMDEVIIVLTFSMLLLIGYFYFNPTF
jgi:hypothetical protein